RERALSARRRISVNVEEDSVMKGWMLQCAAAGTLAVASSAWAIDVAIVAAASSSPTAAGYTETQAAIAGTGLFERVEVLPLTSTTGTPTLAELQQYAAVIVWTNTTPP